MHGLVSVCMTQNISIVHAETSLICRLHCRMRLMRRQRRQMRQNRMSLMMSPLKAVMNSRTDETVYKYK